MRYGVGLFLLAGALASTAAHGREESQTYESAGIKPWSEAVVSVTDLDASATWLREHGGWRTTAEGKLSPSEIAYWQLPETATGEFLKICAPKATTGCIRYIRFDSVEQRPIRPAARAWDTGGIYSIMVRSEDARSAYDAALNLGWWAESEPYEFSFGTSDLVNVVVRGPNGVNYAIYERKTPKFTDFPVGTLSQAFNTMRMVRNQPATLAFYRDTLGLEVLFDAPFTDPEPRANNFSVPHNLATELVRRAAVVQPRLPGETGRIELMQFEGFEGRDFAELASPPNLGIISVRYPVRNLAGLRDRLEAKNVMPEYAGDLVRIGDLAGSKAAADIFAIRDPDGNLTEFYRVD